MHQHRGARALSVTLAAVMTLQAVLGLAFTAEYRDVDWIVATWWGNDWVTLTLAVPLLIAALVFSARGSVRGTLVWAGMLAYAVYNYAYYLLGTALNRFFAIYVVCVVLAAAALVMLLAGLDAAALAERFRERTPVRVLGGYYMFVAAGLSAVWLGTWGAFAFAGRATPVATEAFKLVAALDLTMMVPFLGVGGFLLFRRRAWGYAISAIVGVQASLYLLILCVNSAVAIARGLAEAPGELPIWGTLFVLTTAATVALYGCLDDRRSE